MERFDRLEAVALPFAAPNVDTDQIIPAHFLQKPRSDDFGRYLFSEARFAGDGSEKPDFILNQSAYRSARILVAERNFGCGSSREHAVWALYDYGFRACIAPSFGDIFFNNCLKNGLLPIVQPEGWVASLLDDILANPGTTIGIDLSEQRITLPGGKRTTFDVDPFAKDCMLNGVDELGYTMARLGSIDSFERHYTSPPIAGFDEAWGGES